MESSELLQEIHEFHKDQSRELWSMYQTLKEPDIVARGIALGFIEAKDVEDALLSKLQSTITHFRASA